MTLRWPDRGRAENAARISAPPMIGGALEVERPCERQTLLEKGIATETFFRCLCRRAAPPFRADDHRSVPITVPCRPCRGCFGRAGG